MSAKLTRWIMITGCANLIVTDASTGAVLSLITRLMHGFPRLREKYLCLEKCKDIIQMHSKHDFVAAQTSLARWAAVLCIPM